MINDDMPYSLGLHLGAHRTASTTLQLIMDENEEALAASGLKILTPPGKGRRKDLSVRNFSNQIFRCCNRRLLGKIKYRRRATSIMQELVGQNRHERLLLSDENLLGPIHERFADGIYPKSYCCLVETRRCLGHIPDIAFLSVRDYASFFKSAYAMRALYDPNFFPTEDSLTREEWTHFSRGWDALVSDIKAALPQTLLVVTVFEDGPVDKMLQAMLGKEASASLQIPANQHVNTAPTQEAIEYALSHKHADGYSADEVIDRFSHGETFTLYTQEIAEQLSDRYRTDLEKIRAMPGVALL
ncbi:MAG: hypothetical protein P8Z31_08015 [Gammaproteobacteria bacterium]